MGKSSLGPYLGSPSAQAHEAPHNKVLSTQELAIGWFDSFCEDIEILADHGLIDKEIGQFLVGGFGNQECKVSVLVSKARVSAQRAIVAVNVSQRKYCVLSATRAAGKVTVGQFELNGDWTNALRKLLRSFDTHTTESPGDSSRASEKSLGTCGIAAAISHNFDRSLHRTWDLVVEADDGDDHDEAENMADDE